MNLCKKENLFTPIKEIWQELEYKKHNSLKIINKSVDVFTLFPIVLGHQRDKRATSYNFAALESIEMKSILST